MVRFAVADDYLLTYITDIAKESSYCVGLMLGQTCLGKDYVIHFAKTPPFQTEELKAEGVSAKQIKAISDINENWVADHARHATRMLPGGMYVVGIFVISPEDVLSPFSPKIKSIIATIHKQLDSNKYLSGNITNEKIVLSYSTKLKKCFAKTYDVVTLNVQPADFKFFPKATRWSNLECNLEIDRLHYLKRNEAEWPLQKHIKSILDQIDESLVNAIFLFDGESKDNSENLENIGKKKKAPRLLAKGFQDYQENSKPIHVSIYQSCNTESSNSRHEIFESGGQLRIVGQVASKLWLQPKISIGEASKAIRQDIMRSLSTRFEMHWDSLTEEENSEDINCVHEPPRRVLVTLPNSKITLSDYLFPGEGAQDAKVSLEELLDIKIDGKLEIEDVEGQADITEYYAGSLERESDEVLPKLPTDANKFMYIVGLGVALLVLVISLLIHYYKK